VLHGLENVMLLEHNRQFVAAPNEQMWVVIFAYTNVLVGIFKAKKTNPLKIVQSTYCNDMHHIVINNHVKF
jgi:hypothetical protein